MSIISLMGRATDHYTVIGTLAVDGWAVTLGTARRGLAAHSSTASTDFLLFDVAL